MSSRFFSFKRSLSTASLATVATAVWALAGLTSPAHANETLNAIKAKGHVQCGVSTGLPGFSNPDDKGNWTGLDVDYCRALASAVFGDPSKVKFSPLTASDRFTALQSKQIDVLSRNTTWTLSRDTSLGLNFSGVTYYDGQGFMVKKTTKVASAMELNGATICTQTGTTTELNAADYFRSRNLKYEIVAFKTMDEAAKAYESGRCEAFTSDASQLYAIRLKMEKADDHQILPDIISKEPLGPMVRHGDDNWFDVTRWTLFALIQAEEFGITSKNVDEKLKSDNPDVKRFLGVEGKFGEMLGLSNDWAYKIVKNVGNYGEVFERNVGQDSRLKIARGLNQLWTKGGLQYAPPVR